MPLFPDNPDEDGGYRHPGKLVPVEKGEAEQYGRVAVVQGRPEQPEKGQQEQQIQDFHFKTTGFVIFYFGPG